jgi:hypothetical protein
MQPIAYIYRQFSLQQLIQPDWLKRFWFQCRA